MYQGGNHDPSLFLMTALVNYWCILFSFKQTSRGNFAGFNRLFTRNNTRTFGFVLFILGFGCYCLARGFHFTIIDNGNSVQEIQYGGLKGYLVNFFSVCYFALAALLISDKNKKGIVFYICLSLALITCVLIGGRHRIVCIILSLLTVYHIYPKTRNVNVVLILVIVAIAYLGFSIMEYTRTGSGISLEAYQSLDRDQVMKGSAENRTLYEFSLLATNYYNSKDVDFVLFAPIITALLFPLPRAIFPWKTVSDYGTRLKYIIAGEDSGSSWLSFTDAFMAFGWVGVILNGLIIGWLSALVWNNYRNNKNSPGAIILLSVYNAWCYEFFSRGYLAQNYCNLIFMIVVPIIIIFVLELFIPNLKK